MKTKMIRESFRDNLWGACFVMALVLAGWGVPAYAQDESKPDKDPIFGGQILSLTEPKEKLQPSNDPRFQDNQDGTVSDLKEKLIWKKQDSYQEFKKWMDWEMAQDYIKEVNEKKFAGYDDWRLPTREEIQTLYDENKSVTWKYYWTVNQVHIDPIFGDSSCCFWTSDTQSKEYAWGFNFIQGKTYLSLKKSVGYSLTVVRLVRNGEAGKN